MLLFLSLLAKLLPLYALAVAGYFAGKKLAVDTRQVAALMFHIILPVVVFASVATAQLTPSLLLVPVAVYAISAIACLLAFHTVGRSFPDGARHVLAFSAGGANAGYFGLPVAIALFDAQGVSIYVLTILGMALFQNSLGYYIVARHQHDAREVLRKVVRLPALHAFFAALVWNAWHIPVPVAVQETFDHVRGTYTVLGMMLVGLGLVGVKREAADPRFLGATVVLKHVVVPVIALAIVALEARLIGGWDVRARNAILLQAFCPVAANTVMMATLLGAPTDKAAVAVLASTVVGMVSVPLMVGWFF